MKHIGHYDSQIARYLQKTVDLESQLAHGEDIRTLDSRLQQ